MSTNCISCGSDETKEVIAPQVVDTYGGDYTYQAVYLCKCKTMFYVYSGSNPENFAHFDTAMSSEEIKAAKKTIKASSK